MSETTAPESATPATESAETQTAPITETRNEADLPHWARDELTKANNQAAGYRIKAKEAADEARKAVEAEFNEKLAAVSGELDTARLELSRLQAALAVGIPGESAAEFAARLQGTNEDELKADAEKLKSMLGISTAPTPDRPVDHTQGLGGEAGPQDAFGAFIMSNLR